MQHIIEYVIYFFIKTLTNNLIRNCASAIVVIGLNYVTYKIVYCLKYCVFISLILIE